MLSEDSANSFRGMLGLSWSSHSRSRRSSCSAMANSLTAQHARALENSPLQFLPSESSFEVDLSGLLSSVAYGVQCTLLFACFSSLRRGSTTLSFLRSLVLVMYSVVLCSLNIAFIGNVPLVAQCALAGALLVSLHSSIYYVYPIHQTPLSTGLALCPHLWKMAGLQLECDTRPKPPFCCLCRYVGLSVSVA